MKLSKKVQKVTVTTLAGLMLVSAGLVGASAYNSFEEPIGTATHVHLGKNHKLYTSDASMTGTFKRFWGENKWGSRSHVLFAAQYYANGAWHTAASTTMGANSKFDKIETGRQPVSRSWRIYVGTTSGRYDSHADGYMENRD